MVETYCLNLKAKAEYFVHFVEHTSFWLFPDDVVLSITVEEKTPRK